MRRSRAVLLLLFVGVFAFAVLGSVLWTTPRGPGVSPDFDSLSRRC